MKTIYRKNFGACALLCAAMLSSCASDELQDMSVTDEAIRFSTVISDNAATRAADNEWKENDAVGVFMTTSDYSKVLGKANAKYLASQDGATCTLNADTDEELYYPIDGSNVKFIAYYPYKAGTVLDGEYTVTLGADQADAPTFDLLYCKNDNNYNKEQTTTPALAFEHQLSKIIINVQRSTEVGGTATNEVAITDMTVILTGTPSTAEFDLSTGVLSDQANVAEVETVVTTTTTPGGWERTHQAIIIPHKGEGEIPIFANRKLKFAYKDQFDGNATFTYDIDDETEFKVGTAHSYNFTITGTGVVFEGVTITNWDILSTPENNGAGEDVIN